MKLYRYELGSDDSDEDVITFKNLIGEFHDLESVMTCIVNFYAPIVVIIEPWQLIDGLQTYVALPKDGSEAPDEALWLV